MHKLVDKLIARLPLDFRVLCRQFLLRVIDLEALSIEADIPRFLGQFAGVLIMITLISALGAFLSTLAPPTNPDGLLSLEWSLEQFSIATMMLVIGLITVISWDATFPDRRDVMVLSPLPVAPHTILFAKVTASCALVGLAILTLNGASAFAWSLILGMRSGELPDFAPAPLSPDFLMSTLMMMVFATVGLRWVFALPISLTANWVLRTTQLRSSRKYIAATRLSLLVLAVLPVWLLSALLALPLRPFSLVAGHLAVLALIGFILAELNLIGFYKVPFTCSYLPGKSNFQFLFWGFIVVVIAVAIPLMSEEWTALQDPFQYACMVCIFIAVASGLWAFNRHRAESAVIYFEEVPDEGILILGLQRE